MDIILVLWFVGIAMSIAFMLRPRPFFFIVGMAAFIASLLLTVMPH